MEHDLASDIEYNNNATQIGSGEIFSASSMVSSGLRNGNQAECGSSGIIALGPGHKSGAGTASPSTQMTPSYHRRSHSDPVFLATAAVPEQTLSPDGQAFKPSHLGTSVVGFQSVSSKPSPPFQPAMFHAGTTKPAIKLEKDEDGGFKLPAHEPRAGPPHQSSPAGPRPMSAGPMIRSDGRDMERPDHRHAGEGQEVGASAMSSPTELTGGFCSVPTSTFSRNFGAATKMDIEEAAEQHSDSQPTSSAAKASMENNAGRKDTTSRKRGGFNGRTNEELSQLDPKRVRRILANRESAARSKERKMRYTSELDNRLQTLTSACERLNANLSALRQNNLQLFEQANQYHEEMQQLEGHLEHLRTSNKEYAKRLAVLKTRVNKQNSTLRAARPRTAERPQYSMPEHAAPPPNKPYPPQDWYSVEPSWQRGGRYAPVDYHPGTAPMPASFSSAPTPSDVVSTQPSPAPAPSDSHPAASSQFDAVLYDSDFNTNTTNNSNGWSYASNKLLPPEWDYRQTPVSSLPAASPPLMLDDQLEEHTGDWPERDIDMPSVLSIVDEISAECGIGSKALTSGLFPGLQFA